MRGPGAACESPNGVGLEISINGAAFSGSVCGKEIVGRLYVGNLDVNAELVRLGYAWVYRKYAKDREL